MTAGTRWPDVRRFDDAAQNVAKFTFARPDAVAEAVLYRYPDYRTRTVVCCSTMSGCPMGCRFCGSGDGFVRSLDAEEIVEQVARCLQATGVPPSEMARLQVMFMSMGEPLLNARAVVGAVERLHALCPGAELLVSTAAPRVDFEPLFRVARSIAKVGLQFSVHETTDEARDRLVPFRNKLTLAEIAERGGAFWLATGRAPFFNYCAHDGNSTEEDADRLAGLFDPAVWKATVSVVCERDDGFGRANEHQRGLAADFASKLVGRGFDVRVFDPAGQDTVGGGCGQLWFVQQWMRDNPGLARPTAGTGMAKLHAPGAAR